MHPILWALVFILILWALGAGFTLSPAWLLVILLAFLVVALGSRRNGRPVRGRRDVLLHGLCHALALLGAVYPVEADARCERCGRRWW